MSRISIKDIPRDYRIGREELRRIKGGNVSTYTTSVLGSTAVSGYSPPTGSSDGPLPVEEVAFDYNSINWTYERSSISSSSDWNTPDK